MLNILRCWKKFGVVCWVTLDISPPSLDLSFLHWCSEGLAVPILTMWGTAAWRLDLQGPGLALSQPQGLFGTSLATSWWCYLLILSKIFQGIPAKILVPGTQCEASASGVQWLGLAPLRHYLALTPSPEPGWLHYSINHSMCCPIPFSLVDLTSDCAWDTLGKSWLSQTITGGSSVPQLPLRAPRKPGHTWPVLPSEDLLGHQDSLSPSQPASTLLFPDPSLPSLWLVAVCSPELTPLC
jgi:hypothetical protein